MYRIILLLTLVGCDLPLSYTTDMLPCNTPDMTPSCTAVEPCGAYNTPCCCSECNNGYVCIENKCAEMKSK